MTAIAAIVAAVALIAAASVSAYSAYSSGQATKTAMKYNANIAMQEAAYKQQLANYNARTSENQAIAVEQLGHAETAKARREKARMMARQEAAFGKTGAVISEGTPLLVEAEEAGLMELDILEAQYNTREKAKLIRAGGDISAFEGDVAQFQGQSEAAQSIFKGKQAATASNIEAGSTLLYGVGKAAIGFA